MVRTAQSKKKQERNMGGTRAAAAGERKADGTKKRKSVARPQPASSGKKPRTSEGSHAEASSALKEEIKARIGNLAAKKTPSQRKKALTALLGEGWEEKQTVNMKITEPRLRNILAGIEIKNPVGETSTPPERIRGGGDHQPAVAPTGLYEPLKMPVDLRNEVAKTNSFCFSEVLESRVSLTFENWKSVGNLQYDKVPTYQELGGNKASKEVLEYVQCEMRCKLISDLRFEFPGSIDLSELFSFGRRSNSRGVHIDVEAVAQAALCVAGLPHAALAVVLRAILTSKGNNEFVFTHEANEIFKAHNTPPTNYISNDYADDRVMRSYLGVLISSSNSAANMFGLAGLSKRQKFMGVKAVGVRYDAQSVIFPEVAAKFPQHKRVLDAYYYWLMREL